MEKRLIWFKDSIVDVNNALINILSPTSQFGLNVFEGIRCYWDSNSSQLFAFRLDDHFDRLQVSSKLIGFNHDFTNETLSQMMIRTIVSNDYRNDIAIRMTLFIDGEGSWSSISKPEIFIAPTIKARTNLSNIPCFTACISSVERINDRSMSPRIKAGANYINGRYGQLEAWRNGYDFPIFLGENHKISEGAGACLFFVKNGTLITPTITSSILESITRDTVIKIAQNNHIPCEIRDVDKTELYFADEIFLCGSAAELTPIISVDKFQIGEGSVGRLTKSLLEEYHKIVSNQNPKFSHWLTPIYI